MLPDESRRLTPQQQTAIEYLLLGATITEAACAAGVTRQTVSEWSNHHPRFQTELSQRRAQAPRSMHIPGKPSTTNTDQKERDRTPCQQ